MSALTGRLHRHLLGRFAGDKSSAGETVRAHANAVGVELSAPGRAGAGAGRLVPDNPALEALPRALAAAHKCYGKAEAVVLFVVQAGETNTVDQRLLEFGLWDDHGVRAVRMTLAEVRLDFFCLPRTFISSRAD